MDINDLSRTLRANRLELFSNRDLGVLFPAQDERLTNLQLHQWVRRGRIRRMRRGLFQLAYPDAVGLPDLFVANRLYGPSYVSLDTALSHHGIIPDVAVQVTSTTSGNTRRFTNEYGLFTYFSVKPSAFRGYSAIAIEGWPVLMADPEKAVVDRLYAGLRRGESLHGLTGRWNADKMTGMDTRKISGYALLFGSSAGRIREAVRAFA